MIVNSISDEDFTHHRINTLAVNVSHVIGYIKALVTRDRRSAAEIYPIEITETNKEYIIGHLEHIKKDLLERIKLEDTIEE